MIFIIFFFFPLSVIILVILGANLEILQINCGRGSILFLFLSLIANKEEKDVSAKYVEGNGINNLSIYLPNSGYKFAVLTQKFPTDNLSNNICNFVLVAKSQYIS